MDMAKTEIKEASWYDSHKDVLCYGDSLKGRPILEPFSNVIEGTLEVTKGDIKTIAYKNDTDSKFNEEKNKLAKDIPKYIATASYYGWARTIPGKHPEAAYFVYYYKKTHHKLILCLRKMKASGRFKPYAIISKEAFDASLTGMNLQKRKPNQ